MTFRPLGAASLFLLASCSSSADFGTFDPALSDALISEMETVFSETAGMIDHTMTVLQHALEIHEEAGGNPNVVRAAAILHDIGIPRAREVHGSSSGEYQEIEGPPIAREILAKHQVPADAIDLICGIVENHHSDADPAIVNTVEFHVLWDADWMVNFPRRYEGMTSPEKEAAIEEIFKTEKGRLLARQMFLE